ncbi:T9SS type A sorting domain-containing protein [candidate division KSB1 bacterium]|nr:T9SS type A sorting domain-containing protein [candidate division KSB1 bacterium]
MKEGRMIALDYTFLDVQNNKLSANSSAVFDSYIDLPNSYDDIKYHLGYALYSLEGNGNLPPNIPIFSKDTYNGYSRINTDFEIFVIDPNRDRIDLQINFGNDYTSPWEGNYWSGYNADVSYSYLKAGDYSVLAKASDGNLETEWSKSANASITLSSTPVITTTDIEPALYKKEYLYQLQSNGGIEPVSWQIRNGALPNGLVLNSDEGSITGVPLQSGLFDFSVYCKDSGIPPIADSANFQIKVNNHEPVITSSDTINTFNNTPIKYKTNAIDPNGNSISIDYLNYPNWLSVVDDTLSGITPNQILDTSFTVIASDGDLSDTMTVFISIRTKPLAIISDDLKDAVFMQAYHDTLKAGFGLPPYDWSVTKGDLPKGLKFDSSGVLSGIPHSSGDFQFMARVQDSSNPPQIDSLLLSLNVINHPPQIMSSDTITISRNNDFVYFASAIDPDGNTLFYQYKNYPSWLFVTDSLLIGNVPSTAIDTSFILIASDGELMDSIKVAILVNEPSLIKNLNPPVHFFMSDNYPNPFNPSTNIKLELPKKVNVDISVYDINGKLISEIYSGQLVAGEHNFTWTADNISSGIYFIHCRAEKFIKVVKCTLLK